MNIILSGNTSTGNDLTYQWSTTDGTFEGATNTNTVVVTNDGTYTLTVTDGFNGLPSSTNHIVNGITISVQPFIAAIYGLDLNSDNGFTIELVGSETINVPSYGSSWSEKNNTPFTTVTTKKIIVTEVGTYRYTVTPTYDAECASYVEVKVTRTSIDLEPVISGDLTLNCTNNGITTLYGDLSSGDGTLSYLWTTNDGNIVGSFTSPSITVDAVGTYTLNVGDDNTFSSTTKTVSGDTTDPTAIITYTTLELSPSIETITLDSFTSTSASGLYTRVWDKDGVFKSTASSYATNEVGTYTLTITDTVNGCEHSDSVVIEGPIIIYPTVNITGDSLIDCDNLTATLTGSATGVAPLSYSWSNGATTSEITVSLGGIYTLTVMDGNGRTESAIHTVSVSNDIPQVTINSVTDTLTPNGSIILSGSSNIGTDYQWTLNGVVTGTTQNLTVSEPGIYELTVTDTYPAVQGCQMWYVYGFYNYELFELGERIIINYVDCDGVPQQLRVVPSGNGIYFCATYIVDADLGPNTPQISNFGVNTGDWGTLENLGTSDICPIGMIGGCSGSQQIEIKTTLIPPTAYITGGSNLDCENTTVTLNGNSSIGNNLLYSWSNGGTGSTITVSAAGTYTLTVTDTFNGLTDSVEIDVIKLNDGPIVNLTSSDTVIRTVGGEVLIYANVPNENVQGCQLWELLAFYNYEVDSLGERINVKYIDCDNIPQDVYVTPSQFYYFCASSVTSVDLGSGPQSVSGIGVNSGIWGTLELIPSLGFSYEWTASNGGVISGSTSGGSIRAISGGTYEVKVTALSTGCNTGDGCFTTENIVITEDVSYLDVSITANDGLALNCAVTELDITASVVNGVGTISYEWWDMDTIQLIGTGATITITSAGDYQVIAADSANIITNTETFTITGAEDSSPPTAVITGPTQLSCLTPITLSGTSSTGVGTLTYEWRDVSNSVVGTSDTITLSGTSLAGLYRLIVRNGLDSACIDSTTHNVLATNELIVTIQTTSTIVPIGTPSTLSATIIGTGPFTYSWTEVGDGATIDGGSPNSATTVQASTGGEYGLLVTDSTGCTTYTSIVLLDDTSSDTQSPTAPTNLFAEQFPAFTSNVNLYWNVSSDNVGVVTYVIDRQLVNIPANQWSTLDTVSHPTNTYSDSTASIDSSYLYRVSALDGANNSSLYSNTESISLESCLVEGTKILTSDGNWVLIEDLMVGDELMSTKLSGLDDTNNLEYLNNWSSSELDEIRTQSTISIIYPFETENTIIINKGLLESTPSHIQLVKREDVWVFSKMGDVKVGDKLYDINKEIIEVVDVEINTEKRTAYKLTLKAPTHLYFANEILTHNIKEPIL